MAESGILSDLCSTCHVQKPKYRCPRCTTRTCSLGCSKLHKVRAQCSGLRDPTAFLKKSQLVSPAALDHDYNFLSGLERQLSKEKNELKSKIPAEQHEAKSSQRENRGEQYHRRIREMGVTIVHAPKGMARQRENQSRLGRKSHEIIWSTEWLMEDGTRCVTNVLNGTPIGVAFRTAAALLDIPVSQIIGQKRKRDARLDSTEIAPKQAELPNAQEDVENLNFADITTTSIDTQAESYSSSKPEAGNKDNKIVEKLQVKESLQADELDITSHSNGQLADDDVEAIDEHESSPFHFYLVYIRTSSPQTVLMPIDRLHSFKDILNGQAVLEFPTIQVLSQPPNDLPLRFILAHDRANRPIMDDSLNMDSGSDEQDLSRDENVAGQDNEMLSQQRIPNGADLLAIIQQDIV